MADDDKPTKEPGSEALELPASTKRPSSGPRQATIDLVNKLAGVKPTDEPDPSGAEGGDDNPSDETPPESTSPPGLFEGLKPAAKSEEKKASPKTDEDEETPTDPEAETKVPEAGKDFPTGAKQWKEWKEKETASLRQTILQELQAGHQSELKKTTATVEELQAQLTEANEKLERVAFTDSPKYRQQFTQPKADAIAEIERIEPHNETVKQLVAMMKAGTLTHAELPDLEGVSSLKMPVIAGALSRWMAATDQEAQALQNWHQLKDQYEVESADLGKRFEQQAMVRMGEELQAHALRAANELANELPSYTDEDRAAAAQLLQGEKGQAYIGKAVMAVPALTRQLREALTEQRSLESKLIKLEEERDKLQDALSDYEGASRVSGGRTQGGPSNNGARPHDVFISNLGKK